MRSFKLEAAEMIMGKTQTDQEIVTARFVS